MSEKELGFQQNNMVEGEKESYTQLLKAQTYIWNQSLGFINSSALKCAVHLGIPDIIYKHGNKIKLEELVVALPINPSKTPYIYRIMRILVHSGIFAQEEGGYSLTPSSRLLIDNESFNASAMVKMMLDPVILRPFENMFDWLEHDDSTPFAMTHGRSFWQFNMEEPRFASLFGEALTSDSKLVTSVLVSEGNKNIFEGLDSIVDVGGGDGSVTKAIARAFPKLKCTVFDLPHVVDNIEGSEENLKFVGGDMFELIPHANAVLLKWIIHDWNDEDCVKILKNCKEAIPSKAKGGKLMILDIVIGDEKENDSDKLYETQLFMDMLMMVTAGGQERNEKELAMLFYEGGFSSYKIIPLLGMRSLVEVYP